MAEDVGGVLVVGLAVRCAAVGAEIAAASLVVEFRAATVAARVVAERQRQEAVFRRAAGVRPAVRRDGVGQVGVRAADLRVDEGGGTLLVQAAGGADVALVVPLAVVRVEDGVDAWCRRRSLAFLMLVAQVYGCGGDGGDGVVELSVDVVVLGVVVRCPDEFGVRLLHARVEIAIAAIFVLIASDPLVESLAEPVLHRDMRRHVPAVRPGVVPAEGVEVGLEARDLEAVAVLLRRAQRVGLSGGVRRTVGRKFLRIGCPSLCN